MNARSQHRLHVLNAKVADMPSPHIGTGILGYKFDFATQDFYDLREILQGIEGRFLMTINDTPEVRDIFGGFSIEEVNLRYSCCSSARGRVKLRTELLVSN